MPKAELNISLTALLQLSKAHWAILNDTDFPKAGGVFFLHYKDTTSCLYKHAKGAIHSWWGDLPLIFKPEAENALGCLMGKEEEKKKKKQQKTQQRDKRSENLSGWLRSAIYNLQGSILPFPCTEREEQLQFSGYEKAHLSLPWRQRSISGLHIPHQQEDPARLRAAPSSFSPAGKERSRSPGVHTFLRQRAGLSLCLLLCHVPPGTARLKLGGSTKGTLHTGGKGHVGAWVGLERAHTISTEKVGAFSPLTFVNFL